MDAKHCRTVEIENGRQTNARANCTAVYSGDPILQRIVEWNIEIGHRYLLPRDDGRLLVGTTMEDVGFDRRNTVEAIAGILQFATRFTPALSNATVERSWCGFRPASVDGLPYLGACRVWRTVLSRPDTSVTASGSQQARPP